MLDIRKQTGVVRRELAEMPSVPPETQYLWDWFQALNERRGAGFSINALSWTDMWAFFQLRGVTPEQWEVDTICQIDTAFLFSRSDNSPTDVTKDAGGLGGQITGKNNGRR